MSKYTTEVRFICETYAGLKNSVGYDKVDEVIENSRSQIFGNYPIFDENYRATLESKILRHYYTREICEETVGLWKLRLNNRMNEIMPYFNKLYNSELIEFNPLYDVDLTRDYRKANEGNTDSTNKQTGTVSTENESSNTRNTTEEGEINRTETDTETGALDRTENMTENTELDTTNTRTSESEAWNMFQDTPQGGLNGVENLSYLTNATKATSENSESGTSNQTGENTRENVVDEDTSRTTSIVGKDTSENSVAETGSQTFEGNQSSVTNGEFKSEINGLEDYIEHVKGTNGGMSYSKRIKEFRDTFLNIDMMIIDNLRNLFFYLW